MKTYVLTISDFENEFIKEEAKRLGYMDTEFFLIDLFKTYMNAKNLEIYFYQILDRYNSLHCGTKFTIRDLTDLDLIIDDFLLIELEDLFLRYISNQYILGNEITIVIDEYEQSFLKKFQKE